MKNAVKRKKAIKEWIEHFKKEHGRVPNRTEGLIFYNGFGAGWNAHSKVSSEYMYNELSNLLNNLNDDLEVDLQFGENGYKTFKESHEAVHNFTLKILKKKMKNATHNFKQCNSELENETMEDKDE